jgi:hypothetical protein
LVAFGFVKLQENPKRGVVLQEGSDFPDSRDKIGIRGCHGLMVRR